MVEVDYSDLAPEPDQQTNTVQSKLDKRVHDLISMISNKKLMNEALLEFDIDTKKMPLGKLSKNQISNGYVVLQKIQEVLDGNATDDVADLSSEFYSIIPHDFGRRKPQALDTLELVKQKVEMLETLSNLEIATKILKKQDSDVHAVDSAYQEMKCELVPVDQDSQEYNMIQTYMENTHGSTHSGYRLKINQIFKVARSGEADKFEKSPIRENKKLLWHGSRTMNYMGILSKGLRIAPPEAPSTGYMFGMCDGLFINML
jgi:hypothetical protein